VPGLRRANIGNPSCHEHMRHLPFWGGSRPSGKLLTRAYTLAAALIAMLLDHNTRGIYLSTSPNMLISALKLLAHVLIELAPIKLHTDADYITTRACAQV
jgi:hypothetical protein